MSRNIYKRCYSSRNLKPKNIKSSIKYSMSPEQMFNMSIKRIDFGIEGYVTPVNNFDYYKVMWNKKRQKILNSRKRIWPPLDWPRDKIDDKIKMKPKRITYIDEVQKWCNSYYDKKKADNLIMGKGIQIHEYVPKPITEKLTRKEYLEKEEKKKEWISNLPSYPSYKAEAIEEAENKKKEDEKNMDKDPIIEIRKKYKNHPQSSRCDRVSVISEAIYLGEQIPFYNTFVEENKMYKKKEKLFYPSKDYCKKKFPAWRYPKPFGPNKELRKRQKEEEKQRIDGYILNKRLKKEDLWIKVREGYNKTVDHGKILIKFLPEFKYKDTIQYKTMRGNKKIVHIGPQQYWKIPKENVRTKTPKKIMATIIDDKGNKIYYLDRKITDRRVVTPGLRSSIY